MIKSIAIALCVLLLGIIPSAVSAHPSSAPAPTVTGVSPNQGYNYQPTTITITGSDFVATPTARLNNVPLTNVTFVDSTTLTAVVPADLLGGAYTLTVTNPDSQSASLANAFTVLLSGDGSLETWQATTSITTPRFGLAAVAVGSYIYAIGGCCSLSSVERAAINADGSLGPWQATTSMTTERGFPAAVATGGYIYAIGGIGGSSSGVERAAINADGSLGPWQATSAMTTARAHLEAVAVGGYIYAIGGSGSSVERAAINADGSLGSWQTMSAMTTPRGGLVAVAIGGYIYAIGGSGSSVERAVINPDGSLGSWQATTSMTTPRFDLGAVTVGGYLYALGGRDSSFSIVLDSVERATVNADGSLGPWQATRAMTTTRAHLAAVAVGGYIYALGGNNDPAASVILNSVERAAINPPSLTAFSPSAVSSDNPTNITINGANFRSTPSLQLGSTNLTVSLVSTTTLTTTVPSGWANGWYTATLTNGDGRMATLPNALRVDGPGPVLVGDYGLSINDGALYTNQVTVTLSISSRPDTAQMQVSNDGGFAGAQWETYSSHKTWQITQYGNYVIPRVVYVRYMDLSGNTSSTFSDDIILDVTAPTGSVSIVLGAAASKRTRASTVTLALSATDDVSGVGSMMLSNRADFVGASWQAYATSATWTLDVNNTVYVRFRDNAGNVSQTYSARGQSDLFLPLVVR
jgi:hypothetical protein